MTTVFFFEVGRDKKSWSKQFKEPTTAAIAKEAKRTARLMSSSVHADLSDNGQTGEILVGGWRPVGTFTISAPC